MKEYPEEDVKVPQPVVLTLKQKLKKTILEVKQLQGNPHYVAKGMAIGVFIGVTPTIPLHTVLAVVLAFIFKGSKPAAVIGVWVANPFTIPFFYIASYQIGTFLFKISTPFNPDRLAVQQLLELGLEITIAMIAGGIVIGIPFGIIAYGITWKVFRSIRNRKKNME